MQFSQPDQLKNEKFGFSLVELLLTISAVGFLVLLLGSIPNSVNLIGKSRQQSFAREIISKEIEDKRAVSYTNLSPGETPINDPRINLLSDGVGKTLIEDCNPVSSPLLCPNSEAIKQITVTVTWKTAGKNQEAKVQTIIAEGGLNQ